MKRIHVWLTGLLVVLVAGGSELRAEDPKPGVQVASLRTAGKYRDAITLGRTLVGQEGIAEQDRIALHMEYARCLGVLAEHEAAVENYSKAIALAEKLGGEKNAELRISLALEQANAWSALKDVAAAGDTYRRIASPDSKAGPSARHAAMVGLARLALEQGNYADSLRLYLAPLDDPTSGPADISAAEWGIHEILLRSGNSAEVFGANDELVKYLRRQLAQRCSDSASRESLRLLLIDVLFAAGRFDESLQHAKLLIYTADSDKTLERAANGIARSFKAIDGNLVRTNRFFAFQKHGKAGLDQKPGTSDDVENPLTAVPSPADTENDAIYLAMIEKMGADWQGQVSRSTVHRFCGKPRESLAALKRAYSLCPVEQEALQKVTDRIISVLTELSGDPDIGRVFVEYQKYGKAGADKKIGTGDDLADPMGPFL